MPFNGSGTFSIINTFVPNTTILSAAVNQNFTDIATGLSDCLTRDGQAGMTAIFKAISGSVSAPGITFNSDATAGLFLQTTGIVGLVAKSLGLLVNSSIYQLSSATVQSGGSNYAVGDTILLTGGTAINQAVLTVATLSGSAVATVTVAYPGNYSVVPSNPVSQGSTDGSGSSATFNLTFAAQYASSIVTNEAGALPWQRLGSSSFVSGLMAKVNAYDVLTSLVTAGTGIAISHATNPVISATLSPPLVPNYISGLTLSTAGSSGTMSIAAGVANDSTNTVLMNLSSAISKTTSSWAVGTGNGGLDTGAIANTIWYHFYEIYNATGPAVDVIFSLSASAPALPSGYTLYRRIGSGRTDSSAHWLAFTQFGNDFILAAQTVDFNTTIGTSRSTATLTVPTGVTVKAKYRATMSTPSGGTEVLLTALVETDVAPTTTQFSIVNGSNYLINGSQFETWTNTSAQIGARAGNAGTTLTINTYGWTDLRGMI